MNRELKKHWVEQIAANFSEELLGVLTLWDREDGTYTPIMGQHRAAAASMAKGADYEILADVLTGLTEREACDLFLQSSHVLAISSIEKFLKAVTAGWTAEVEINKAVQGAGFRVSNDKRPRSIRGVSPLRKAYQWGGSPLVKRTLIIARDSWGEETEALSGMMLGGIARALAEYGDDIIDEDMVAKLQRVQGGPAGIHSQARVLQQINPTPVTTAVANVMISHLNKGRRGQKRLAQIS